MSKKVEFEGQLFEFPDDATQEEMAEVLQDKFGAEPVDIPDTDEDLDMVAQYASTRDEAASVVKAFPQASEYTLANEVFKGDDGSYTHDPDDPGGETKWGISKRAYPDQDIKSLTKEQALALYKRDYWDRPRLGKLPQRLAVKVFDAGVNMGAATGVKLLQRQLGVPATGVINDQTVKAAKKADEGELLQGYVGALSAYYQRIVQRRPKSKKYLKGWLTRAKRLPDIIEQEGDE